MFDREFLPEQQFASYPNPADHDPREETAQIPDAAIGDSDAADAWADEMPRDEQADTVGYRYGDGDPAITAPDDAAGEDSHAEEIAEATPVAADNSGREGAGDDNEEHESMDPRLVGLHQRLVEAGNFDAIPPKEQYGEEELVVAKRDGDVYRVLDTGADTVTIWYEKESGSVRDTVPRDEVRGIAGYGKLAYETAFGPDEVELVELSDDGHGVIAYHTPKRGTPPPFPGASAN